jgi:cytoskeleton protein RodZ
VFEIGNSLREARLRQGLDLARVEDDTKIRAKYLQALEDERFDVLPAETYVKGFLRTYSEYLGLDGQLYVDEFNSRFAAAEEPLVASAPPGRRPRPRRAESSFVVAALAGIVAVAVLFVVAFAFREDEPADPARDAAAGEATPPAPASATLVLRAAREPCEIRVRAGGAAGEVLFEGTLGRGRSVRWIKRRFSLHFPGGPCENLRVAVNGKRAPIPVGATTVSITARGVTPLG